MVDKIESLIPIVVVTGPTCTGKSKLAVEIALQLNGEVISADSMQIYMGLDIGTAKSSKEDMKGIPHHMIDIASPSEIYTVDKYLSSAKQIISEITNRNNLPIICGGTGLYISSLINGVNLNNHPYDLELRKQIEKEYDNNGGQKLLDEIVSIDPLQAERLHHNDKKRIVRAIEIIRGSNFSPSSLNENSRSNLGYRFYTIVLVAKDRDILYERINNRIDSMVENGLLEEVEYVFKNRNEFTTAAQAIGYKELFPYLEKKEELSTSIETLKQSTRRYAKRQITWFKKLPNARFIDYEDINIQSLIKDISDWKDING